MKKKTSKNEQIPDISHWNHRVIFEDGTFYLTEVYYNEKIKPIGWSEPIVVGDTIEELLEQLTLMSGACIKPVLEVKGNKLCTKK